jgi:ABC-type Zn uptake system ZnuABC Zn-binding protein ZnuA
LIAATAALVAVAGCASSGTPSGASATSQADAITACASGTPVQGRPLRIATTVAPITSIVAAIVGNGAATVTGIVPEGTNSHTFEPQPSAAKTLETADIVFINGLLLEDPTKDLATANLSRGSEICELGTATLPQTDWIFDFSFPKSGGKPNPHLWTNPPMARTYGKVVLDALSHMDPANAAVYQKNFDAFAHEVDALDTAMLAATASLPAAQRELLTYHDAYAYFAQHYGWKVVGAIQPSNFEEPTTKEVADLINQVKSEGVKAIFGSEVFPSSVLEQIGNEAGVKYVDVLRDDDLPGAPGEPDHSWFGLMRFDFVTIIDALGGDSNPLNTLPKSALPDHAEYPQ